MRNAECGTQTAEVGTRKEMTEDRWDRVQQVFEAALACPPAERDRLLAERCGSNTELRAEVESLLAHDEQAPPDFMRPGEPERQSIAPHGPDATDPRLGSTFGRYRIEKVIAAGGMGTVYLAQQQHPRRAVALKVMRPGLSSRSSSRRFEYESEILAHLKHPHIAQVYEAGIHREETPGGPVEVPYFVMEYIEGAEPITRYANEKQLGTRKRLELSAQVCDAVHHGHQKGIIHRDLKPANILVDASGQVKIIDFGVARSTDADIALTTMRTDVGELIGTLQYMSPEQCAANPLELDTRSDVYALGLVLYELLCGQVPYDVSGTTIYEAARVIRDELPARPGTINRGLRGDLETIVLKALSKNRDERYQSAADLARDIQHYLNREPIEARPPTLFTQAHRWALRNPVWSTVLSCVLLAAGILGGTRFAVWLDNSRPFKLMQAGARQVRLIAYNDRILHRWDAQPPAGRVQVVDQRLIERPPQFGGGRLAILSFHEAWEWPHPRSVCGFDVDADLNTPVLQLRLLPGEPLPDPHARGYRPSEFGIELAAVVEVFEDSPGEEVLVVYGHFRSSQRAIRLYDLGGKLLYQVWHDGAIQEFTWLQGARLLVFLGQNSEVQLAERGITLSGEEKLRVAFAIRPELDQIHSAFLDTDGSHGRVAPAWYKGLLPCSDLDQVHEWYINPQGPESNRGRAFRLGVALDEGRISVVGWAVDEFGNEVSGSKDWNDEYQRNLDLYSINDPQRFPDPSVFKLVPFAEIAAPAASSAPPVEGNKGGS